MDKGRNGEGGQRDTELAEGLASKIAAAIITGCVTPRQSMLVRYTFRFDMLINYVVIRGIYGT